MYHIVEISREILLRNARSIKKGPKDVRGSHTNYVPKHNSKDGVIEPIQNIEMNQCNYGVTRHQSK